MKAPPARAAPARDWKRFIPGKPHARRQDQPLNVRRKSGVAFDAVVVGARLSAGMYMLHRLRGLGFTGACY